MQVELSQLAYVPDCASQVPAAIQSCGAERLNRDNCGIKAVVPEVLFQDGNDTTNETLIDTASGVRLYLHGKKKCSASHVVVLLYRFECLENQ